MSKPKLQLTKLKPTETNEISVVPHGANLVPRYDIVKDSEVCTEGITKEDFEEIYEEALSYDMWNAFKYALSRGVETITHNWDNKKTKEEKLEYLSELFTKFLNDVQSNEMLKELHEETEILKAKMKTDAGKKYPASSYLFTPDKEKVSTWKLRVYDENGVLDKDLLSAAIASFSEGGYRGNRVQLPVEDAKRIKAKLKQLWISAYPDKDISEMPEHMQKEDTPEINIDSAKKQEKSMEKETLVQKVMAFVESLKKSEEAIVTEPVADITKSKELEVQEIQKQLDESKALIQKERDDLEVEKLAIAKEKEAIESERIVKEQEIADKQTKSELLSICKEKLSFIDGTVDENVEKLFEVKKSIEADKFEWLVKALKKKSEIIEKMMDESGTSTPDESDMTADGRLAKIAKSIQQSEGLDYDTAFGKACEQHKDLRDLALGIKGDNK